MTAKGSQKTEDTGQRTEICPPASVLCPLSLTWHQCYETGWKGLIVPEAFAHPAKFSRALIERIYDHMLAHGYISKGDTVGDPFGGIGTGGIIAAYRGLRWVGVELEAKFVALAEKNFELHRGKWQTLGLPVPIIHKGDSRKFDVHVAAIVSSPPYADNKKSDRTQESRDERRGFKQGKGCFRSSETFGQSDGQIGTLKESTGVEAVVTSPPYEDSNQNYDEGRKTVDFSKGTRAGLKSDKCSRGSLSSGLRPLTSNQPETYWQAMKQVYAACFSSLKPGGYIAVVVKDYVKNKQRVPLCDDTLRLLVHLGFTPVERIRAMLVEETEHNDLLEGTVTRRKERKSFFRRLAEKKGSPRIDWEEVLICRKR